MKIFFRISVMKFQKKIFSFQNECLFESLFSIFGNCNSFEDFSSEGATVVRSGVQYTYTYNYNYNRATTCWFNEKYLRTREKTGSFPYGRHILWCLHMGISIARELNSCMGYKATTRSRQMKNLFQTELKVPSIQIVLLASSHPITRS